MRRAIAGGLAILAFAWDARGQGPDPYFVFPFEGTWTSALGSVTAVTVHTEVTDDALSATQTLPFGFQFFGVTESDFKVCTNGWMTLDASETSNSFTNVAIPSAGAPNRVIAPFWDDLLLSDTNAVVLWDVTGTVPDRVATVEWRDCGLFSTTAGLVQLSFQVALFETTGVIEFRYDGYHRGYDGSVGNQLQSSGSIGIEDATGTSGTEAGGGVTTNEDPPPWNLRFVPNGSHPDGVGGVNGAQGQFLVNAKGKMYPSSGDASLGVSGIWHTALADDGAGNLSISPIQLGDGSRTEPLLGRVEGTHFHASSFRGDALSGTLKVDGDGLVTSFKGVLEMRTPGGNYQMKVKGSRLVP